MCMHCSTYTVQEHAVNSGIDNETQPPIYAWLLFKLHLQLPAKLYTSSGRPLLQVFKSTPEEILSCTHS